MFKRFICLSAAMVVASLMLLSTATYTRAGWPSDSCSRSGSAGSWSYYTGQAYCGHFHLGWGSDGTDRIRWYTNGIIPGRDMYMTYRHGFTRRSNGDTSADHWVNVEGGYSGNAAVNQSGSGNAEHTVGAFSSYNWDDWLEIGSDGGGSRDTIANMGRFYPELDAVYSSKITESYMYLGNVYQWRYVMNNPSQAYWSWGDGCRFGHTGGVTSGPGWFNGNRVINSPGTGPGGAMDLYFNMRPTANPGDYNEDFQMVYEGVSWYGDKVASNGNMRTWTRLSRKAPGSTDGWDNGGKRKGDTLRFSVAGADSWGTGNTYSWDWDASTAQGWYAGNACTVTQEDANDRLRLNVSGADPYCYSSSGLAINANTCKYITIRMWSNGGSDAQLFWSSSVGGWSGERHVDWNIVPDSQWHVYRVPLPASWSGTVYQIRLDPIGTGAANGQTVYVDWLRIHHASEGMSGRVWLSTNQSSWDIHNAAVMDYDSGSLTWYKDYTVTAGYPQTYYACLRMVNDNSQESDNHDRRFGGSGGGWGYRSYKVLNTEPAATNTSFAGNAWTNINTPDLAWSYNDIDSNAQSNYRVQVDDNSDFSSPVEDTQFVSGSSTFRTSPTLADGQWYYRTAVLDGLQQTARNAAYTGGVTLGESGPVTGDTSASFDGTDDHAVIPAFNDSFGSGMTVEFWAKPTSTAAWSRIIDFGNGPANDNILIARPGATNNLHFEVYNGTATGGQAVAAGALINNEWHHYACVLNSNQTVSIYRDGVALGVTGATVMPNPVNRTINYIGRSNWAGDSYYAGGLDELAIYDRPLSQSEIQAHYNARNGGSAAYRDHILAHSPWAYYRFGEPSGTTAANINGGIGWSAGTGFRVDSTKPVNPSATCSDGKASGDWRNTASPTFTLADAADNYSGLKTAGSNQRYRYYFGTSSSGVPATGTDSTTIAPTFSGDGTYYLRVQTQDNAGNWSDPVTVFEYKYDGTDPDEAGGITVTGSYTTLKVDWTEASDNPPSTASGFKQFELYRGSSADFDPDTAGTLVATGTGLTYTDSIGSPDQVRYYKIRSVDNAGNTSTTASQSGRTAVNATNSWTYSTGASVLAAPGIIPYSTMQQGVFAGSNDRGMHGVTLDAGNRLYAPLGTGGAIKDRVAVIKEYPGYGLNEPTVFASSEADGVVYSQNAATGAQKWAVDVTSGNLLVKPAGKLQVTMSESLLNGRTNPRNVVLVGTYDLSTQTGNSFVCLDMADGYVYYTTAPGNLDIVTGSAAIYGTTAYFTSYAGSGSQPSLWALDIPSGTVAWSKTGLGNVTGAPALSADGSVVYCGNTAGTLFAVSTGGSHDVLWSKTPGGGAIYGAPFITSSSAMYVATASQVHKIDPASGNNIWSKSVTLPSQPIVGSSGNLYVGGTGGHLYQMSTSDGSYTTFSLGASGALGDPVVSVIDGSVYVGAADGRIYKVIAPF